MSNVLQLMTNADAAQILERQRANVSAYLRRRYEDMDAPGYEAEFDPPEAAEAGMFAEDALSESDAKDSVIDLASGAAGEGA